MKWFCLSIAILMQVSCASLPNRQAANFDFKSASEIVKMNPTTEMATKDLGKPSQIVETDKSVFWHYMDQRTGYQRLTLKFDNSNRLDSVLWIPDESEAESKLDNLFARYSDKNFEVLEIRPNAHDSINTETLYSDNSTMTVLHNDFAKQVEAVTWYKGAKSRTPTHTHQNQKTP